ncbi:ATP-binding cassette domain-containing protein [Pseudodesulfovibrio sp.]|uniref:ATP-binding cassette domain-containing protein n=1 Tax=Pseudodesulfovibrio sp. TaxID=2035812 RepID=UPI00260D5D9B|nr:ATP-binding cassette domain-containing protein [Pseudodesulfovibrio sp.]MDD3311995.1 ATP-binding cassette domain-containing protein [Pseudodesulfovibrio sp.]
MHHLIELEGVAVTRAGLRLAGPLDFILDRGRHTALVGENGAGKTTLLRLLRGDLAPDLGGRRVYDFGDGPQRSPLGLRQRIGLVSPDMQDFYTLNAPHAPARSVILAGFCDSPLLYGEPTPEQAAGADRIIERLGIGDLAVRAMGTLSTGQARKVLVARALASGPDVLVLDEYLDGLDQGARAEVLDLLERASGLATLVMAAHRAGDLPPAIRRVVVMADGRVAADLPREEGLARLGEAAPARPLALPEGAARALPGPDAASLEFLLRIRNASVVIDGNRILDRIDWEVLPGEHWLVLGENGAGKSTLLRLVLSDLAPYADDKHGAGTVERLGGMTMDAARPLIGVVSPALQASYGRELGWEVTALETVVSGRRGSVGMFDEPTDAELLAAREWLERVGLGRMADRPLRRMSYGQQRRVLLARAMAAGPRLLLLDEPFSGLDPASRADLAGLIGDLAAAGTPLVLVTHNVEDRLPAINRVMILEGGRQLFCGPGDGRGAAPAAGGGAIPAVSNGITEG